jgi:hypothetical protein
MSRWICHFLWGGGRGPESLGGTVPSGRRPFEFPVGNPERLADRRIDHCSKIPPIRFQYRRLRGARSRYSCIGTFDQKGLAILSGTFHHSSPFGCPPNRQQTTFFDADLLYRAPRRRSLPMRDVRRSGAPRPLGVPSPVIPELGIEAKTGLGRGVPARKLLKPEHSGRYRTLWVGIAPGNRGVL